MTWFERLEGMTGRMALTRESEAECLAHYTSIPGDHIEVGCLWGGTAILTALAKQDVGSPGRCLHHRPDDRRMVGHRRPGRTPTANAQDRQGQYASYSRYPSGCILSRRSQTRGPFRRK